MNPCCLAQRVNSGIGPSCAKDGDTGPAKALHRVFEHSLNRPLIGLTLPACEMRSVILKNELQRSRLHCANYRCSVVAANSNWKTIRFFSRLIHMIRVIAL